MIYNSYNNSKKNIRKINQEIFIFPVSKFFESTFFAVLDSQKMSEIFIKISYYYSVIHLVRLKRFVGKNKNSSKEIQHINNPDYLLLNIIPFLPSFSKQNVHFNIIINISYLNFVYSLRCRAFLGDSSEWRDADEGNRVQHHSDV